MSNTTSTNISDSGNLEILIVDDDKIIQILHSRTIELCKSGHPISVHENGKQALEYIRQRSTPQQYFLILIDLNMPVMNGWKFLQECQSRKLERIFTCIVTSSTNIADRRRSCNFPQVIAYCEKPFTKAKMGEILELEELQVFLNRIVRN